MKFFKIYIYKFRFLVTVVLVAFTVVLCSTLLMRLSSPKLTIQSPIKSPSRLAAPQQNSSYPVPTASVALTNSTVVSANSELAKQAVVSNQTAHGHFPYGQADPNRMMLVSSYATGEYQRFELLAPEAGKALMKMIYAARDEGVWIIPVSGFRTIEQQQKLFQAQINRRGSVEAAAKLSAPPGYSEHQTGFAVDLADGNVPKQDLTIKFEDTKAYLWLTHRAKEFGFELSFAPSNLQGVSYEPWHWRYVGSPEAAAVFAKARNLQ